MTVALPCELGYTQRKAQSLYGRVEPSWQIAGSLYPDISKISYLIAGRAPGPAWVTSTRLAAMAAGEVPKVGGTTVTIEALDMGKAWALPSAWVTMAQVGRWAPLGICAQKVAGTAWASQDRHSNQGALSPAEATPTISSHIPTHGDSSVGQLAHGSQACNGHSGAPPCCVNNASIAPCGDHRHQGPWGQCFHCTHTVGTCHLALMGPQSAQEHKLHTEALSTVKRKP